MRYSATKHHSDICHCILLKLQFQCIEEGFWLFRNFAQIVLIRQNSKKMMILSIYLLSLQDGFSIWKFASSSLMRPNFIFLGSWISIYVGVELRFSFTASRRYSIFNWNTDHNHSEALLSTGVPHYRLCYSPIFQLQNYSCSAVLWNHSHLGNCQNVIKIFVVNSLSLQVQPH